ncbi:MAG: hypothetical protein Q8P27_00365 [Candidatus Peregrinibacteria bacterium]|nr:hypothetical protein [Candidatus Peregrinibacteria bacterium]
MSLPRNPVDGGDDYPLPLSDENQAAFEALRGNGSPRPARFVRSGNSILRAGAFVGLAALAAVGLSKTDIGDGVHDRNSGVVADEFGEAIADQCEPQMDAVEATVRTVKSLIGNNPESRAAILAALGDVRSCLLQNGVSVENAGRLHVRAGDTSWTRTLDWYVDYLPVGNPTPANVTIH